MYVSLSPILTAAAHTKGEIKRDGFLLEKEGGQGILLSWGEKGEWLEIFGTSMVNQITGYS